MVGLVYASTVLYPGNSLESNEDGLVLDLDLTQSNYVSGTRTFADVSGEGNDGVSYAAANFTSDEHGKSKGAVKFNGTGDYIDLPFYISEAAVNANGMSWGMWIKTIDSDSKNTAITQTSWGAGTHERAGGMGVTSGKAYYILYNGSHYIQPTSVTTVSDGNWHHIVGVFTLDGYMELYVNGVLEDSDFSGVAGDTSYANIRIAWGDSSGFPTKAYFNGSISSVKVYDRPLSASEVTQLYNSYKPKASAGSLQKGLIGHWVLDAESYNSNTERITDKTPYENHGTNSGATLTHDRKGNNDSAMYFDGGSDRVTFPASQLFALQKMTISMWINADNFVQWKGLIYLNEDYTSNYLIIRNDGDSLQLVVEDDNVVKVNMATPALPTSTWIHVVFTQDGTAWKFYLNGQQNTFTGTNSAYSSDHLTINNVWIGYSAWAENYYEGLINEVHIYDRDLSPDEIYTLYNSYRPKFSAGSLQKGLVLDMPLTSTYTKGGGAGSEIMTDRTPYSNDGTNSGGTVESNGTTFDGGSDYVDAGNDSSLDITDAITIEAWVNSPDNTISRQDVVEKVGIYKLALVSGKVKFWVRINGTWRNTTGSTVLNNNEWTKITGKYDNTDLKVLINGVEDGSTAQNGSITTGTFNTSTYIDNGIIRVYKLANRNIPYYLWNWDSDSWLNIWNPYDWGSGCNDMYDEVATDIAMKSDGDVANITWKLTNTVDATGCDGTGGWQTYKATIWKGRYRAKVERTGGSYSGTGWYSHNAAGGGSAYFAYAISDGSVLDYSVEAGGTVGVSLGSDTYVTMFDPDYTKMGVKETTSGLSAWHSDTGQKWFQFIGGSTTQSMFGVWVDSGHTTDWAKSYSSSLVDEPQTASSSLYIGWDGQNSYFNGTIDKVRIYDRALSPSEVKLSYDKGR